MGYLSNPTDAPTFSLLRGRILALNPTCYWSCRNIVGSVLEDEGSAGIDLTASGAPLPSDARLLPCDPDGLYVRLPTGANKYIATNTLAVPFSGDYTALGFVVPLVTSNAMNLLTVGAAGETEAANYQTALIVAQTNLDLNQFWEQGAGVNVTVDSNIPLTLGVPYMIATVKDGTANTVTFYKNAMNVGAVSYANEPTGGSTAEIAVGDISTSLVGNMIVGNVAFWLGTKLTDSQIANIAQAAGLFGPP